MLGLMACGQPHPDRLQYSLSGSTMGTTYNINIVSPSEVDSSQLNTIHSAIEAELASIDSLMSTYKLDSEVSRFNRAAIGEGVSLSAATIEVLNEALALNNLSEGSFDPTVGPLIDAWGFGGGSKHKGIVVDEKNLASVLEKVGVQRFKLVDGQLYKLQDVELDLSAIAKGFAADKVAIALRDQGIANFLVEIGGEVVTHGRSVRDSLWVLGIESPDKQGRNVYTRVHLGNAALATSGDYRNYFEENGKRYSHTIDPLSGRPVEHLLASVSVIAEDCMLADGLATALMVMGEQRGYEFASKHNISALFIYRGDEGLITMHTDSFKQYLK
ncbi:hypothetical protein A3757_03465 [Oleiphilus sp. HI0117]|nr:hypothetical protein A3732_03710 [Oleiphilus sp. HI0050]KZZ33701.1 hypothetical protein A3756_18805 [Oleiphilus sp. HI0086]KZZ33973.1 hypothetical protein A3757_03465 [Oleiphilus sp. HI0117]KZZ55722.1 hypothetical protein A3761_01205 [Oleiphilus sp. HI0123]